MKKLHTSTPLQTPWIVKFVCMTAENQKAGSSHAAMFWSCDQLADKPLPPAKWRWGRKWNGTTDNDDLINSKIVYWGSGCLRKTGNIPVFGQQVIQCVYLMGKLGLCMLSHSFSYPQLEQTLHALWVINNTKMGQSHPYKYNYIHIIQLSTNWSQDCIFHNNVVSQLEKQKRLELQVNNWVRWLISTVASVLWK